MFAHFLFSIYLTIDKWSNLHSFFKRCAVKSSTKTAWRSSYQRVLMIVSYTQNETHILALLPTVFDIIKMFGRRFLLCMYLAFRKWQHLEFLFQKMCRRKYYKSYMNKFLLQNKFFQAFFIMLKDSSK